MRVEIVAEYNPDATVRRAEFANPAEVRSSGSIYRNFAETRLAGGTEPAMQSCQVPGVTPL